MDVGDLAFTTLQELHGAFGRTPGGHGGRDIVDVFDVAAARCS